jgi:hypothetical protein
VFQGGPDAYMTTLLHYAAKRRTKRDESATLKCFHFFWGGLLRGNRV